MLPPAYDRDGITVHHGQALDVLATLPDESVDSVVTDPPYGIGFMEQAWDTADSPAAFGRWCEQWARECFRVLRPGAHLVAFGGARTWHRLAVGVEDAGFELRDSLAWLYGTGFPKGVDVARVIDRRRDDRPAVLAVTAWLAAARDRVGLTNRDLDLALGYNGMAGHWTTQATLAAVPSTHQWEELRQVIGFGHELDAEVARLNARKGEPGEAWHTREVVATAYRVRGGTGDVPIFPESSGEYAVTAPALDEARRWHGWHTSLKPGHEPAVLARKPLQGNVGVNITRHGTGALNVDACRVPEAQARRTVHRGGTGVGGETYRHGATAYVPAAGGRWPTNVVLGHDPACTLDECAEDCPVADLVDQAPGAAKFFPAFRYQPKAPASERPRVDGVAHPTVKPLALMRWLVRLVTPPGGLVLDPFAGSGTTAEAARAEGFRCVAVEREPDFVRLIRARLGDDPHA